jgi:hypothetical protein
MPSIIDQIRQQQAWQQAKKPAPWPLVLGVVVAFVIGGIGVHVWRSTSATPSSAPGTAQVQPAAANAPSFAAGLRVGRAETAPLLRTCVPLHKLGLESTKVEPADIYRLLQVGTQMSRVVAATGLRQDAIDGSDVAALWADVADCVYRQNGWALCDPDNRALAIEAAGALSRQVSIAPVVKREWKGSNVSENHERKYQVQNAQAVKQRVLAALRHRVEEGRLIPADFGLFTHEDVRKVLSSTKPRQNACAGQE